MKVSQRTRRDARSSVSVTVALVLFVLSTLISGYPNVKEFTTALGVLMASSFLVSWLLLETLRKGEKIKQLYYFVGLYVLGALLFYLYYFKATLKTLWAYSLIFLSANFTIIFLSAFHLYFDDLWRKKYPDYGYVYSVIVTMIFGYVVVAVIRMIGLF